MRIAATLVLVFATACLDEPETTVIEQHETVVEPPVPHAWCSGCTASHVAGEPVRVQTSFHGVCKFGWEYPCQPQPYLLSITCNGQPCQAGQPTVSTSGFTKSWPVQPPVGTTTIRVAFIDDWSGAPIETLTLAPFTPSIPDAAVARCKQGNTLPCVAQNNVYPVQIAFALYAGEKQLWPENPWTITSAAAGYVYWGNTWVGHASGDITVAGQYGAVGTSITVHVAPKPPPPPRPRDQRARPADALDAAFVNE